MKTKIMYETTLVKVPVEVRDKINLIYAQRKVDGNPCRKLDIYMEMANKVKK